jgi:hypothetical protein
MKSMTLVVLFILLSCFAFADTDMTAAKAQVETELVAKYGEAVRPKLHKGIEQVSAFWRAEDGDAAAFQGFVGDNFMAKQEDLDATFARFEFAYEQLDGHMLEIGREIRKQTELDLGPILPIDEVLAGYDPSAHMNDDFFENKIAFIALLHFPLTTLKERLDNGSNWSRRQWAEARLAQRFSKRIPANVIQELSKASAEASQYIADYNLWMHHALDERGNRLFPAKLRLLTHWNLRDEIKAEYSEPGALPKQRLIQQIMERIVTQTIPAVVINNPNVDWKVGSNTVMPAAAKDSDMPPPAGMKVSNDPEPNTRYAVLLNNYKANKLIDPYSPTAPTLIARSFDEGREIPEERVRAMFEAVLSSPVVPKVAKLIQTRLGRNLEPFDIWYNGFRARGAYTEEQLDAITRKKYPTADAYKADIPRMLQQLGFTPEKAQFLANNIIVDPARGSGHAMPAARRADETHLRTRVEQGGMNYKGYNIAVHEMGHNCEQTFSLDEVDHTLLSGVPNTAFTEALAFVFQGHDLELLGLTKPDEKSRAMKTLDDFWAAYEIAGVALVDMGVWHWMYDHPDATPAQLRDATVQISKDIWNKYYAPVFGKRDVVLLGIYSHMINETLYLPNYPIGHLIAFQIEQQMEKAGNIGAEFERMTTEGSVTPDLWMIHATGAPVGPDALLTAADKALQEMTNAK